MTPTKTNLSGPGGSVLLSAGAEGFDPDSMVEDLESPLQPPEENTTPSSSNITTTIVTLRLQTPGDPIDEPFQIIGFLHAVRAVKKRFEVAFHCLLPLAIELCAATLENSPTSFISCDFTFPDPEEKPCTWEFPGWSLAQAEITEVQGSKALVFLRFLKPLRSANSSGDSI